MLVYESVVLQMLCNFSLRLFKASSLGSACGNKMERMELGSPDISEEVDTEGWIKQDGLGI